MPTPDPGAPRPPFEPMMVFAAVAAFDAVLALALFAGGPLGSRAGWWPYTVGLPLTLVAVVLGAAASVIALFARQRLGEARRHSPIARLAGATVWVGAIPFVLIVPWALRAFSVPAIHDLSTDVDAPPGFAAPAILAAPRENALDYDRAALASVTREAYPGVRPIAALLPPEAAFARAHAVATDLGWDIVEAEPPGSGGNPEARIEASVRSRWFGFVDDVSIRIRPTAEGSRIDLRSVSRVGESDLGANAARIEAFIAAFDAAG